MQITDEVDQLWTSMRLESGKVFDRNHTWLQNWARCSRRTWLGTSSTDFPPFSRSGSKTTYGRGEAVSLIAGVSQIDGEVLGIDSQGALRLKVNGVEKAFSGGELSLRLRDDS